MEAPNTQKCWPLGHLLERTAESSTHVFLVPGSFCTMAWVLQSRIHFHEKCGWDGQCWTLVCMWGAAGREQHQSKGWTHLYFWGSCVFKGIDWTAVKPMGIALISPGRERNSPSKDLLCHNCRWLLSYSHCQTKHLCPLKMATFRLRKRPSKVS